MAFSLIYSTCERCDAPVGVDRGFLEAVERGEAVNLCNRCFWQERKPTTWRHYVRAAV